MPTFSTFCNVVNVVRVPSEVEWVRAELVKALTAFMAINRDLERILTIPPLEKRTSTQRTMFASCDTVEWANHGLLITRTGTDHFFLIYVLQMVIHLFTVATDTEPGKWLFDEVKVKRQNSAGNPYDT